MIANVEWSTFLRQVPWHRRLGLHFSVGVTRPAGTWRPVSDAFSELFRPLADLLAAARQTDVAIDGASHLLFSWSRGDGSTCSWLSPAPGLQPPSGVCAPHDLLLRSFGGIVERANEPEEQWLANHEHVLTREEALVDASFILHYAWAFEDAHVSIPIDPSAFYCIASEANGNRTLCRRDGTQVLLFAPDHSFDHIQPLAGCPAYTLYTIDGASDFTSWVNVVARQWLSAVRTAV